MFGHYIDVPFIGGTYIHGLGTNTVTDSNAFCNLKVSDISATSMNSYSYYNN